jgi:glycosyltransferase involved in cell wall biosynthesis
VTGEPLITVITPTWQRHELLLNRAIPSVQAQDYPAVEHLIVSDGPDPLLAVKLTPLLTTGPGPGLRYYELPEHAGHWGVAARRAGIEQAASQDLITYLDDDDAYRPRHISALAAVIPPGTGFAYAQMQTWTGERPMETLGADQPTPGTVGTCVMHHRETLTAGTWERDLPNIDFLLVDRWIQGGCAWAFVPEVTCDCWCSCWNHPRNRDGGPMTPEWV